MKEKENANLGMSDDPELKDSEPDMNDVKAYPYSSEANPRPDEIEKQKDWNRKKL